MAADQNPVSSPGFQTAIRAMISGSHGDPEAEMFPKLHQDILFCSLSGENTLSSCIAVKANISPVGLFAHYEPERRAAEVQKDVTELDFSQIFNGCEEGKSHSCEFFQLQVCLAGRADCRAQARFHMDFQPNASLDVLGFKMEFVKLSVMHKTNKS